MRKLTELITLEVILNYFNPRELLEKSVPTARAAYSDRTAWLMAEMSNLAYLKFEGDWSQILDTMATEMASITDQDDIKRHLTTLVDLRYQKEWDGRKELEAMLAISGFSLVTTFNSCGTQAFLAKRDIDNIAVLVFRGTESTQKQDILADLNCFLVDIGNSKIHAGFRAAFDQIKKDVHAALATVSQYNLYITGHSLGGALAIVATRELESDTTAACYTFGSPRVATSEFGDDIKTPIYRVINAIDIVPRMPPGAVIEITVDLLKFAAPILPLLNPIAKWLDTKVSGYIHHGDARYLTPSATEDASDVKVLCNLTFLARWRRLYKSKLSFNQQLGDHRINEYCRKLGTYALNRCKKPSPN